MRKQLLKLFLLVIVGSSIFISCNEDDAPTTINPDRIARFLNGDPVIEFPENSSEIIEVPVYINYEHNAPVTINYEIDGDPSTFTLLSEPNQVVIPAQERQGVILLQAVDNDITNNPVNSIIIRITGADGDFGLPTGVSVGHAEKRVVFLDDECPVDAMAFAGTYSVAEVFTSGTNEGLTLAGAFGESYQMEISAIEGDETNTKLEFNNSSGFNTYLLDGTTATLDACNGAVVFDGGAINVALFADMDIQSAVFDDTSFIIQANGPLGNFGPYQFIFTKQ